jgi:predicted permease
MTISKLFIAPCLALMVVAPMVYAGWLVASPMLLLVILMQAGMPTANNMLLMSELAGGRDSKALSTTIFVEYCAAPLLLTASLTAFMSFVQALPEELAPSSNVTAG